MRSQSRHFVVEVKRGTNRAAFTSPDALTEKFGAAEQALFGSPGARAAPAAQGEAEAPARPAGRVLRSLIEPPPPVTALPEPPRRGRKPGSRNRPKLTIARPDDALRPVEPSSPELPILSTEGSPATDRLAARADGGPSPAGAAEDAPPRGLRRPRLRERSIIIKRYVLGTEARPGEGGRLRARRLARRSKP